jgi:exodeoxyribonuclease VII small subunit
MVEIMASSKSKKDENKIDFEATTAKLDAIISKMEGSDISLETSLEAFEDGIKLTREAQAALNRAEQKVQLLLSGNEEPSPQNFDAADEDNL